MTIAVKLSSNSHREFMGVLEGKN